MSNHFLDRQRKMSIHLYRGCFHEIEIQIFNKYGYLIEEGVGVGLGEIGQKLRLSRTTYLHHILL